MHPYEHRTPVFPAKVKDYFNGTAYTVATMTFFISTVNSSSSSIFVHGNDESPPLCTEIALNDSKEAVPFAISTLLV